MSSSSTTATTNNNNNNNNNNNKVIVSLDRVTWGKGGQDKSMVCINCSNLAVSAPGMSCGMPVCGTCCFSLRFRAAAAGAGEKKENDDGSSSSSSNSVALAVGDKILCPHDRESGVSCTIEVPVDRALVRRMEENLWWVCTCAISLPFGSLKAYETHVKSECPDRTITCRWCFYEDKASLVIAHETNCIQREVTCPLCSITILFSEADGHKNTDVATDGTRGCKGVSWCHQCSAWQVGTTQEAVAAHTKVCPRQIVRCDDCGLECVRSCLDSHRDMNVQCLRQQLVNLKAAVQLAKIKEYD